MWNGKKLIQTERYYCNLIFGNSLDWPSYDGKPSFTQVHSDWQDTLTPAEFSKYCAQYRYGVDTEGEPVALSKRKKRPDAPEVEYDDKGEPQLPEEKEDERWGLKMKEVVIRSFMTEHYRESISILDKESS